jgi:hypothetical protein
MHNLSLDSLLCGASVLLEQQRTQKQLLKRGRDFISIPLGLNEPTICGFSNIYDLEKSDSKVLVKRRQLSSLVLITVASFDRLMEHEAPDTRPVAIKFLPLFCFPP